MLSLSRPTATAFPLTQNGRLPPQVIFEAGHRPEGGPAFTHVSACLFARSPMVTFTRVLQHIRYLLRRSGCYRPSDRLAGWDSHPLEIADFHGILGCWSVLHADELLTQAACCDVAIGC